MADQITTSLAQAKVLVMKGQKGETGATPELSVGEVTTLSPGSNATATLSGTAENPVLNLGIPRGANGADGQDATGFALLTMDENSRVNYNNAPITGAEVIALAAEKNAVFLWDEDNGRLYAFNGEQAGAAVFYYPLPGGNGCMLQILAANETETTDAWNPVLPSVTAADNGKVLGVVNGAWAKKADEGGSAATVDSALSSTSENPVQNKVINAALQSKGTDSKPSGGIPASDLAQAVQTSLGKADTALQEHQSLAGYATESYVQTQIANIPDELPAVAASDNGKFLRVVSGAWAAATIPAAESNSFGGGA